MVMVTLVAQRAATTHTRRMRAGAARRRVLQEAASANGLAVVERAKAWGGNNAINQELMNEAVAIHPIEYTAQYGSDLDRCHLHYADSSARVRIQFGCNGRVGCNGMGWMATPPMSLPWRLTNNCC
jgi:hypothetical protein